MRRTLGTVLAVWIMSGAHAHEARIAHVAGPSQPPNPALIARDSGVDDDDALSHALEISDLDVTVEVVGNVAHTMVAARFTNTERDDLEGTFTLQLPDGAIVTGYALDVEGEMIEGVLAPPIRARRAYEQKVRAGIDPGVAEVARGNVFSTRVYPILAGKGRTIRLTFAAPIHAERGFRLPIATQRTARAAFSVRVRGADASPNVAWPTGVKSEWRSTRAGFENAVVLRGQALSGALFIAPAKTDGRVFVTRHPSGKRFVELRDSLAELSWRDAPRSLRVYWDRSASRRDDRLRDELIFLRKFIESVTAEAKPRLEFVSFNSSGATVHAAADFPAVAEILHTLQYRGGTSFASLATAGTGKADTCLLFTDGVSSIDDRPELELGCTLFIVTTAADADMGYLELLARKNAGAAVRLAAGDPGQALFRRIRGAVPRIVDVRDESGRALDFAPLPAGPRGWALVAEAPASGEIVVRVDGLGKGIGERRYTVTSAVEKFAGAGALWAGDRVSQLAGDGRREKELQEISVRYSIASPAMSFIVLESPVDYLVAKVAPPRGYPKARLAEYRELKAQRDAEEAEHRREWLDEIVASWDAQKEWWGRDFATRKRALKEEKKSAVQAPMESRSAVVDAITAEDIGRVPDQNVAGALQRADALRRQGPAPAAPADESLEAVTVTGFRASERTPEISVELEAWNPDRPYLDALTAASPGNFSSEFVAQEKKFGAMPVFYFDVAEWLYRKQRVPEAIEVLLSALELPSRDTETIGLVADRLLRYGQLDRAIWLYEEVCRLDPDRPQPARTLALALEQRARAPRARAQRRDLERALALLTDAVMTPPAGDFEGVELVALMDANEIIPRLRALGVRKFALDPRLVATLDVDLRVVIQWNTGATDMDLWVDQPDGERSIYSNPETDIGGRLSNDMTEGYGPEEYLLRRAMEGEYTIRVNVYSSDALNPNGATMVTAHLTRNFGRENQSTETMELELKPEDSGEKLVGRFRVGG